LALVTGGAGFIGSHVAAALVADGWRVRVVDRAPPTQPAPGVDFVLGDITHPTTAAAVVDGVDSVSHHAAKVGLEAGVADMVDYVHHNDLGTATLLSALGQRSFTGRLVLASSMVVYGEGRYRCEDHGRVHPGPRSAQRMEAGQFEPPCPQCGSDLVSEVIDEDGAIDPRNIYAATKLHQEHLCATFARQSGSSLILLRYHNVYGPGMPRDTPYAGVAAIFASAVRRGEAARVFEDGSQRRDFVHVSDVARANVAAMGAAPGVDGPFNIASGSAATVLDMARAVWTAMATAGNPPEVTGEFRLGDVRHIVASPERAARDLGFRAQVTLDDGIAGLGEELAGDAVTGTGP